MSDLTTVGEGRDEPAAPAADAAVSPAGAAPRGLVRLAQGTVLWERLWPALWPATAIAGLFLSIALLDLLPLLPAWAHGATLVAFAALLTWLIKRGLRRVVPVGVGEARHRIERDSGLRHRPLTALRDRLAAGADDAFARALWRAHLERAAADARGLRLAAPSPGLARLDPHALRAAVMILVVVGLVTAVDDPGARLGRALFPATAADAARAATVEIWITPPAYTGKPPIFLKHEGAQHAGSGRDGPAAADPESVAGIEPVTVPAGSAVLAQVSGLEKPPSLRAGAASVPFASIASPAPPRDGGAAVAPAFRAEATIEEGERLAVESAGATVREWPLRVVPDRAPTVAFIAAPGRTQRAQLRVDYEAEDDYGLADVVAVIRQPDDRPAPGGEQEIRLTLRQSQPGEAKLKASSLHDLSAHPWAGTTATIRLEAKDARDQIGLSDTVTFLLPERFFNHPVARALAEQRKRLSTPSPETIEDVVQTLENLSMRPAHFSHDTVVYLALRIAIGRLAHDGSDAAIAAVQKLLWETALRIEDGKFSIAERDLRELQERLQKALRESGRDSAEVEKLLDELRRALDKFLSALAEDLQRQGREAPMPFDPNTMREIESTDLHRMIEEARELARSGQIDAARRMLSELQRMLQALQQGLAMGPQNRDAAKGRQMMDNLRELNRRQQQLLDRSFQKSRRGERGQQGNQGQRGRGEQRPGEQEIDDARAQNALRRMLGNLMTQMDEMLGNIPDPMGRAERAMREAEGALGEGNPGRAVPHQTDAVEALREAIDGAGEQMARRFGGQGVVGQMPGGERSPDRDPFGRQRDGATGHAADGDVKVPDRMERRRAREILDELRRRAGERERPVLEREYIERLLRQF